MPGDLDLETCVKKFAAKLKLLLSRRLVGGSVSHGAAGVENFKRLWQRACPRQNCRRSWVAWWHRWM